MKNKIVWTINISAILLLTMLSVLSNVPFVKGSGTIYIRSDGSIDPPTALIQRNGDVYTFMGNINDSIIVERNNVVLDGAYHTLQGAGSGTGVHLSSISNVTIKNVEIRAFERGIYLRFSNNCTVFGSNTTSNNQWGIYLEYCNKITISQNSITSNLIDGIHIETSPYTTMSKNDIASNNQYGIYIGWFSDNNTVSGNNVMNNKFGVELSGSSNNVFRGNGLVGNKYSFGIYGMYLSHFIHDVDNSNTVDGKPICYLLNRQGLLINPATYPEIGYLALVSCLNVKVEGLTLENNEQGLLIAYTNNSRITNNSITENGKGVMLHSCNNNTISENKIIANSAQGIFLDNACNNTISGNEVTNNSEGIYLESGDDNTLASNTVCLNNGDGIRLYWSRNNVLVGNNASNNKVNGVELMNSNNNTLTENDCSSNIGGPNLSGGIGIAFYESSSNAISGNNIADNQAGIVIQEANDNVVFHNNIIDNSYQTWAVYPGGTNTWDNGYPSGGNYWSDYTGTDNFSGPHQDEIGSDGIGDTQYIINYPNGDRYPLMKPWYEHELRASVTAPATISQGRSSLLNATVQNLGRNDEIDVGLVLLINQTTIASITISLLQTENSYTLNHLWTPTAVGTYNVTSYVQPLLKEMNKTNNQATAFVTVSAHQPPVASFTHSPMVPIAGKTVTFDASASYDPDGSIISYSWEFGDSTTGSGKTATHAYTDAGSYTVTLTVADNDGSTDTKTSTLTILAAPKIGVKTGDWIKLDYTIAGAPSGTALPQWIKIEFLSVEGTTANVRATMHMSDGTEPSQTMTIDISVGSGAFQGLSGFVVPANCTTGDCVYISGYGNVTIAGETTRTYAGASRTVVYASLSQLRTQLTYYWDKQIGVMVEASMSSAGITGTAKAAETNMWQAQTVGLPFDQTYLFIIAALVIAMALGSIAIVMRRKKKPPEIVTATEPTT